MPLEENPYFLPIMRTIDMIAGVNEQKQREERAEERQIAYEGRQEERQIEAEERQAGAQEYEELTKAIQMYPKQLEQGAEPDPDMLQSMVERRNDLIKSGDVTPRMMADIPQVPEAQKQEQTFKLDSKVAAYFNVDPETELSETAWRIYNTQYKSLTKPPKDTKETEGGGLTFNFGGKKVKQSDVVSQLQKLDKEAVDRYNKGKRGAVEVEGIDEETYIAYRNKVDKLLDDARKGIWSEEHQRILDELPNIDAYLNKFVESPDEQKTADEILRILKGEEND